MCGRGRFAILAAYEVDKYAQGRHRIPGRQRREQSTLHGGDRSTDDAVHDADADAGQEPAKPVDEKDLPAHKYPTIQNLSPGMECPVLVKTDTGYAVENMIWGIIPTYLNPPSANDHYRMFNKRIESLEASEIYPYFKTVLQTKRCVVVMDGFYEWKEVAGKKHPHYVSLGTTEPMKMAGIYEDSIIFDPKIFALRPAKTFSIITGEPCSKFASMHNRMPILLTDTQVGEWLDCPSEDIFKFINMLKNAHLDASIPMNKSITFYPVSPKVTNPRYQESDCIQEKSIGLQMTSFFKAAGSPTRGENGTASSTSGVTSTASSGRAAHTTDSAAKKEDSGHAPDNASQKLTAAESKEDQHHDNNNNTGQKRAFPGESSATGAVSTSAATSKVPAREHSVKKEVIDLVDSPPAKGIPEFKRAKALNGSGSGSGDTNNTQPVPKPVGASPVKTKPITSFFSRSPKKT